MRYCGHISRMDRDRYHWSEPEEEEGPDHIKCTEWRKQDSKRWKKSVREMPLRVSFITEARTEQTDVWSDSNN